MRWNLAFLFWCLVGEVRFAVGMCGYLRGAVAGVCVLGWIWSAFGQGAVVEATVPEVASTVPGVVIAHSAASSGLYIGSPSIAILTNGDYLVTHDFFGPKSKEFVSPTSVRYRSKDRGVTWAKEGTFEGCFWSGLFVHRGAVFLMGTDKHHGNIVIRQSLDNGATWSEPKDQNSGVLRSDKQYHTAPMPVIEQGGRLWRAFEDAMGGTKWGERYRAGMLSVPVGADLLQRTNWVASEFLGRDPGWLGGGFGGWLEGNAVATRDGKMLDILRVDTPGWPEKAAIVEISEDGRKATFDPAKGFIDFPGGAKKFVIRYDSVADRYWALATIALERHRGKISPSRVRNSLALVNSADLRSWQVRCILLYHPDTEKHGFQYADWQFDDKDIVAAVRTAYDDGEGGAHNNHDANYVTFHRIGNFRELSVGAQNR